MIAIASSAPAPTREEIIGHLQKKVSASRLTLFLQCRLKFFFRYVAGLTKSKTPALHVGGTVHAVLKAWNKARWKNQPLTLKELHDEFTKAWADGRHYRCPGRSPRRCGRYPGVLAQEHRRISTLSLLAPSHRGKTQSPNGKPHSARPGELFVACNPAAQCCLPRRRPGPRLPASASALLTTNGYE
jgi:hypothetical protein